VASEHLLLVFLKLVVVGLGSAIVLVSYGAYRRTGSTMMRLVSIGFVVVTLGSLVEGILFEFFGYGLLEVHIVESTTVLAGLLTLIYSLKLKGDG
jgi:hypothetical protein